MITSMTAFAHQIENTPIGVLSCDIRALNHRYLDIIVHLPEPLRGLEAGLRQAIQACVRRGKLEVLMQTRGIQTESPALQIHHPLLDELSSKLQTVAAALSKTGIPLVLDPTAILAWPGLLLEEEHQGAECAHDHEWAWALFRRTLEACIRVREQEGARLQDYLLEGLDKVKTELASIKAHIPACSHALREKIRARFDEASLELDASRLTQEIVWLSQKTDITEELQRIEIHVSTAYQVIESGGLVGRRLDFLMQELHREVNTINSKSTSIPMVQAGINLKVYINQIREQVQNIE